MTVEIVKADDVWTIIHNRPEARNAMDPESADDLVEAFNEFNNSGAKKLEFFIKRKERFVLVEISSMLIPWVKVEKSFTS